MSWQNRLTLALIALCVSAVIAWAQDVNVQPMLLLPSIPTQLSFEETTEAQNALLWEKERHMRWRVHMQPASPDMRLISEGEFDFQRTALDNQEDAIAKRNARLKIELDQFRPYGRYYAKYQWDWMKDREGFDVQSEWPIHIGNLQMTVSQWWDNIRAETSRTRTLTSQAKARFTLAPPDWPMVSLSYAQRLATSVWEPPGSNPTSHWFHTLGISLFYGQSQGYATATTTYTWKQNRFEPDQSTSTFYYELSGAYYPSDKLFIMPTVSFYKTRYQPTGARFQTRFISVPITYRIRPSMLDLSLHGWYLETESSDAWLHDRMVNATGKLTWHLSTWPLRNASISLNLAYYQYMDWHYIESRYESVSGAIFLNMIF